MVVDPARATSLRWHQRQGVLACFVTDLVAAELAQLRPGSLQLPDRPWAADLALDERGLGLDSLERLSVASALSEALHLDESGIEDTLLAKRFFGEWLDVASDGLDVFDARLTFRTSGSSGVAKACSHALADLLQEVEHLAGRFTGIRRVLSAVPAHHMYGFLHSVLLPDRLDCPEVIDVRHMTPHALSAVLQSGDLMISHPAHWSVLAKYLRHLPPGVHGVTSTAHCPDALATQLKDIGLESLVQVYGSSETAGIGIRQSAGAPFQLMPFWSRDPADGSGLVRTSADGSLSPHPVQDHLEWLNDRQFSVVGRLDEAVQVGGTNVFPSRVREVLLAHPQVSDAAVRLMTSEASSRLKAFVVPAAGTDVVALIPELLRWTETRLSVPERPKAFSVGDQLPRNALGKLTDWSL